MGWNARGKTQSLHPNCLALTAGNHDEKSFADSLRSVTTAANKPQGPLIAGLFLIAYDAQNSKLYPCFVA